MTDITKPTLAELESLDFSCFKYKYDILVEIITDILIKLFPNTTQPCDAIFIKCDNGELKIPKQKLKVFISSIKDKYNEVPYHSFYHAFSVFHMLYLFLNANFTFIVNILNTQILKFILLMAGLFHDINHCGYSNDVYLKYFEKIPIDCHNEGFTDCKDTCESPLENHHATLAENMLISLFVKHIQGSNKSLIDIDIANYLKIIFASILHTDMSPTRTHHKEMINLLKTKETQLSQQELINVLVHCADISNPVLPFELFFQWSVYVNYEFYKNAQLLKNEQSSQLTIDLIKNTLFSDWFIINLAKPLWEALLTKLDSNKFKNELRINLIKNSLKIKAAHNTKISVIPKEKFLAKLTISYNLSVNSVATGGSYTKHKYDKYKHKYFALRKIK